MPVRLVVGPRDVEQGTVEVMRRDTLEKEERQLAGIADSVAELLEDIQRNVYDKALKMRDSRIVKCDSYDEFKEKIEDGGFFLCHWDGTTETEERIKAETKATIRCIPLDAPAEEGKCMVTGRPSHRRVIIARAY